MSSTTVLQLVNSLNAMSIDDAPINDIPTAQAVLAVMVQFLCSQEGTCYLQLFPHSMKTAAFCSLGFFPTISAVLAFSALKRLQVHQQQTKLNAREVLGYYTIYCVSLGDHDDLPLGRIEPRSARLGGKPPLPIYWKALSNQSLQLPSVALTHTEGVLNSKHFTYSPFVKPSYPSLPDNGIEPPSASHLHANSQLTLVAMHEVLVGSFFAIQEAVHSLTFFLVLDPPILWHFQNEDPIVTYYKYGVSYLRYLRSSYLTVLRCDDLGFQKISLDERGCPLASS